MRLLTELEVSERTGIAASTLRKWRCRGVDLGPPFVRLNGAASIRYPEELLDTWMSRFLVTPALEAPTTEANEVSEQVA